MIIAVTVARQEIWPRINAESRGLQNRRALETKHTAGHPGGLIAVFSDSRLSALIRGQILLLIHVHLR